MPNLRVKFYKIDIGQNGDNAGATWKFRMYVNGEEKEWTPGNVEDGTNHSVDFVWELWVNDDGILQIDTGGYEEDTPPIDPHDPIFSIDRRHSAAGNWGIGATPAPGNGEDISYTVHYLVEKTGFDVKTLRISDYWSDYLAQSEARLEWKRSAAVGADEYAQSSFYDRDRKNLDMLKELSESKYRDFLFSRFMSLGWGIISLNGNEVTIARG